jgi:hypothetical protein
MPYYCCPFLWPSLLAALSYGPPYSAAFSECPTTAVLSCGPPYLLLCLTALLILLLSLNALLLLSFPAALPTCYFLFHCAEMTFDLMQQK